MLKVKPYPPEYLELFGHCFKDLVQKSCFEYIIQRWEYTEDEYDLDQFFDEFKSVARTEELFHNSIAFIQDQKRFKEAKGSWKLFRLRKDMFYWAHFGRCLLDLFRFGSGEWSGYRKEAQPYYKKYLEIFVPDKLDEVIFYSDLLYVSEGNYELTIKESQDLSGLHNREKRKLYVKTDRSPGKYRVWLSQWFQGYGDDKIILIQNKTKKEITFMVMTNWS